MHLLRPPRAARANPAALNAPHAPAPSSRPRRALSVAPAASSSSSSSSSPSPSPFSWQDVAGAARAFADPHAAPLRPGSEHGEAFSSMSGLFGSGGARRLDVDALNEQLQPAGALRLRHASKPDEAHGAIFAFDSVVCDLAPVKDAAWRLLARRRRLPLTEGALRAARERGRHMPPDAVAARVFGWARSWQEGRELALEHAALGAELLASEGDDLVMEALGAWEEEEEEGGAEEAEDGRGQQQQQGQQGQQPRPSSSSSSSSSLVVPHPLALARDGAVEWLDALTRHGVPCAAVSSLDRRTLQRCLQRVGLHDHFDALVSAEDEPESLADRLLMASVKLRRPPRACASFDATPEGVTAAHNASMRCVAVAGGGSAMAGGAMAGGGGGGGARHALRGADLTVYSLRELSVYNMRKLFAGADTPGRLELAREGAERERGGGQGGGGGAGHEDDNDDGKARWRRRWSSRRATAAAGAP